MALRFLPMPILIMDHIMRFWDKVEKTDSCWLWTGCKQDGYGRQTINGKQYIATRISYWMHYRKDPGVLDVGHECHNRPCVNPDHLLLETHQENMKHMVLDGRHKHQGMNNPKSKLRDYEIPKILELENHLTLDQIGKKFGVSDSCIDFVLNGTTWSHLTGRYK